MYRRESLGPILLPSDAGLPIPSQVSDEWDDPIGLRSESMQQEMEQRLKALGLHVRLRPVLYLHRMLRRHVNRK